MTNDEQLIQAVLGGDRDRYGRLVEPYVDRLHAISYSYLGDVQAAEDVTQDALVKGFTSLRTLADPRKFGPWLRQITRNLSLSALRRNKVVTVDPDDHRDTPDESVDTPRDQVQIKEAGDLLQHALKRISPKISETVVLFYLKNQSISEISEILGVSDNTVKQRLHRGRSLLRDQLEEMVLKDGRRKVELSEDFLPGMVALLPAKPAANSLLTGVLSKLAALPLLFPLLSKLLVAMACSGAAGLALASDVDPSNKRAKRSIWVSNVCAAIVIAGIILGVHMLFPRYDSPNFLLGLSLFFLIPTIFLVLYFCRAGSTWQMKLSVLSFVAIGVCLICIFAFPQYALFLWPVLILIIGWTMVESVLWNPALNRPGSGDRPVTAKMPADGGPVSIDFLHDSAGSFLKTLNTPFPLFHNIEKESDHVRYSPHPPLIGKLIRRLSKLTERWGIPWCRIGTARLYPDGTVDYQVDCKDGFPAHWGTVEEEEARVSAYIAESWASFAAGDEIGARSLTPEFFPKEIFPTRKGRSALTFGFYVAIVIYTIIAITSAITIYQMFFAS